MTEYEEMMAEQEHMLEAALRRAVDSCATAEDWKLIKHFCGIPQLVTVSIKANHGSDSEEVCDKQRV